MEYILLLGWFFPIFPQPFTLQTRSQEVFRLCRGRTKNRLHESVLL